MQEKIGLITLDSAEAIGRRVNQILSEWRGGESFSITSKCPRFSSGEAKCIINESVRDKDIYILLDVCNTSLTYQTFGEKTACRPMTTIRISNV